MAEEIIEHPELLALHGEKRQIFVLFSDLEGFTKMSHAIAPEMVATLLNRYLDMLSEVVLEHGGVIDKFVGDAVVAFWGAPIARPDDGERAARAGYAHLAGGRGVPRQRRSRRAADRQDPRRAALGRGGGRQLRRQEPHPIHRARRLHEHRLAARGGQQAARDARSWPAASSPSAPGWTGGGRWAGSLLRGRASPVDLFEPAPDFPEADRAALVEAIALIETDIPAAVAMIAALVEKHPADTALANLLHRTRNLSADRAFVLG